MSNELNIDIGITGLSPTAQLIQGNAAVGSAIALTESLDLAGYYSGDMPAVAAGTYAVAFRWDSGGAGSGKIYWDGTAEIDLFAINAQLPTNLAILSVSGAGEVTAGNMRGTDNALLAGDYVLPLTSPQTATAVVSGLTSYDAATASLVSGIPTNPLLSTDARLNNLDSTISSRLASADYITPLNSTQTQSAVESGLAAYTTATAGDVAAVGNGVAALNDISTAEAQAAAAAALTGQGYTTTRAPLLDKLNVTGILAHSDAAALYRADVAGLSTFDAVADTVVASNMRGTDNALLAATYVIPLSIAQTESAVGSELAAYGAATGTQVGAIPINPLLATDARLDNIDASISSRLASADYVTPLGLAQTEGAVNTALGAFGVATAVELDKVVAPVTGLSELDGPLWRFTAKALELSPVSNPGFEPDDRTLLTELWQRNGLDPLNALTSTRVADVVTETFGPIVLTQTANVALQQVVVTRGAQ